MGEVPDADAIEAVASAWHGLIQAVYSGDEPIPGDAADWSRIAGALQRVDTRTRWCREASVAIARRAGASWGELERDTGVADSTLSDRHDRFLESGGASA